MRLDARNAWLLLPILGGGVAFATVRTGIGDRGASDASAAAMVAAAGPKDAAALERGEKKKIRLDPELATALYRVGLQPERLAAAGVEAAVTDDVVVNVKSWLAEHPTSLIAADEALLEATKARDALFRKVRAGLASSEEVAGCQAAKATFDRATVARTALLDAAFAAGTRGLPKDQVDLLSRIQVNSAAWNIPLEYLVVDRTQEEWVRLRTALVNERISAEFGDAPDSDDQAYLATIRALFEVATVNVNLDTNLGAITDAWEEAAAVAEEGQ